jgi:hypothetical protein
MKLKAACFLSDVEYRPETYTWYIFKEWIMWVNWRQKSKEQSEESSIIKM